MLLGRPVGFFLVARLLAVPGRGHPAGRLNCQTIGPRQDKLDRLLLRGGRPWGTVGRYLGERGHRWSEKNLQRDLENVEKRVDNGSRSIRLWGSVKEA